MRLEIIILIKVTHTPKYKHKFSLHVDVSFYALDMFSAFRKIYSGTKGEQKILQRREKKIYLINR